MNLKEEVLKDLQGAEIRKVRYYKESPYQKKRFKPKYVEQEIWIYTINSQYGYCITEETFKDKKYWKEYKNMILGETKEA